MNKLFYIVLLFILPFTIKGQSIKGKITDEKNQAISGVNIIINNKNQGIISDNSGNYNIEIPARKSILITYQYLGYETEKIRTPILKINQIYYLDIKLKEKSNLLSDIVVTDQRIRKKSLSRIKTKHVNILPSGNSSVESILKTLPGVSSTNELSSQYSVRGGSFDENLVYINGIEIYRPFLIRNGKQEGLSLINPDMVGSILFSAGGFEAKYGDKMSSVLDITYKKIRKNETYFNLSLLGASISTGGTNNKTSYLIGARYKSNQYILKSLDTKAEYKPKFYDIQTLINYKINKKWEINLLGNISRNEYNMVPENRDTDFGTVNEALKLRIYFEGQEFDKYTTYFGAINTKYNYKNLRLDFTSSTYHALEEENFDILGEYWLYQLENNLGSDDFGNIAFDRGVGKYINHARNILEAKVINISHQGKYKQESLITEWGINSQQENITDKISEWVLIDSAFYNFPHPNDSIGLPSNPNQQIILSDLLKTKINLKSYRTSGYIQISKDINNFTINAGTRGNYWSQNEEVLFSPRLSLAYAPVWEKDIVFRAATGIYHQPPFYKELRTQDGILKNNVKAQQSIHYVLGSDYLFYSWGRPFKWVTEIYYKDLNNLIPYKVDNVQIKYLPNQISNGYATGIDIKINGEFVSGIESWASLSIMKTEEDIVGDTKLDNNGSISKIGFIPRPTDQRVNFSMFFQDYLPKNPNYKMHLNLVYGSGLPFGPPNSEKHEDILRIPDYRRADIGFSAILKSANKNITSKWLNKFNSIWVSLEVFNILDINNTVSYLWVADITGREYAVPNFLTKRQLNTKIIFSF